MIHTLYNWLREAIGLTEVTVPAFGRIGRHFSSPEMALPLVRPVPRSGIERELGG